MFFAPVLLGVAALTAGASADGQQNGRKPVAIRKMSGDSGEKFYMHYWKFEDEVEYVANSTSTSTPTTPATSTSPAIQRGSDEDRRSPAYTSTSELQFLPRTYPPAPPYAFSLERLATLRSSPLQRRDFECPSGTNACTSINRPDSCCGTDETCVTVEDTGSGDVGCCPAGQDCSGTIGACWTGYTSCSSELGGGCCFPGYECVEEGCSHVVTVTLTLSSTTLTTTSTETVAPTSTSSSSSSSSTESSTTTTETESSSTSSTSTDLSPPDRPTSASTTTSSESETETSCPTGFYACAAVYQGGCCQTGRNCDTTSCPAMSSSTFISDGRTIVIAEPTDAPSADEGSDSDDSNASGNGSGTSQCATGWFSCADTVGGGCCPTGYACGASCTAVSSASTTGTVAKEAPTVESRGGELGRSWVGLICAMSMVLMLL